MSATGEAPREPVDVPFLLRHPESLRTVYQPIVELATGRAAGYEALTRIDDWPSRSPVPWFRAAGREGLGAEFAAATLRRALLPRRDLPPGLFLSVNVDPAVLDDRRVTGVFLDEPDLHGLMLDLTPAGPPGSVSSPALTALRARGAMVALDVVEAGMTDLRRVSSVRPDVVRFAPEIVQDVDHDPVRQRLVRLTVQVSDEEGAVTLGEGIEQAEQARHLQSLGVLLGQGWFFGRARPGFLPPSVTAAACVKKSADDLAAMTTVRSLVVPVTAAGWQAESDERGRLRALRDRDGRSRQVQSLVRLKADQDLLSAARRVLARGGGHGEREWADVSPVVDETGSLLGVVSVAHLMEAALRSADFTRVESPWN